MSKKMSKILMLAVALVLAVSMICMVACSGGTPLKGEEAMETLQDDFINSDAEIKTVTEEIKIGGIDVAVGTLGGLKLNNVDIKLIREYTGNVLSINANVSNIQAELYGQLGSMLPTLLPMFAPDINIDTTAIANLSKVRFEVGLTYNKTRAKLTNLTIYGLNEVKDSKGNQLSFLKDGDGNPLGATYKPGEIKLDEDVATLLAPLSEYSSDSQLATKVKKFIDDNYMMISLFDFGTVTVNKSGNKITSEANANLDRVFNIAQSLVDGYKDHYIGEDEDIAIGDDIVKPLLGTTDVKEGIAQLLDLGKVKLSMDLKYNKDAEAWKINTMEISDTMKLTISSSMLNTVLSSMLPAFIPGFKLPDAVGSIVDAALASGLSTNINISVKSSFSY